MAGPFNVAYYDLETDGLLDTATKIHSLVIKTKADDCYSFTDADPNYMPIEKGLEFLARADMRVGHNIQDFDERVINKLYPGWQPKPASIIHDTLIIARVVFPDLWQHGTNNHKLPPQDRSKHSLDAWGQRLGCWKGDYAKKKKAELKALFPDLKDKELDVLVWRDWNQEMQDYCEQDVEVTFRLHRFLTLPADPGHTLGVFAPGRECLEIEHDFAHIIRRQEKRGFRFDFDKAIELQGRLKSKEAELELSLTENVGEWWSYGEVDSEALEKAWQAEKKKKGKNKRTRDQIKFEMLQGSGVATIKKTRRVKMQGQPDIVIKRFGKNGKELKPYIGPPLIEYEEGATYTPIERTLFNPRSRDHVRYFLWQRYNWTPPKETDKGTSVIDDGVLRGLPYPEATPLAEFYATTKILGQLAEGQKSWIKLAEDMRDGTYCLYCRLNTNGAYTGRCTHSNPNLAQVPSEKNEYGHECRALFIPRPGYRLVGWDGQGLELRMLGHYTSLYDGGAYARLVVSGDPHAFTAEVCDIASLLLPGDTRTPRDAAKTIIYAFIYGAGNEKLGHIIDPTATRQRKLEIGAAIRDALLSRFEALGLLTEAIKLEMQQHGNIKALDGRYIPVRSEYAALNTKLQSAGAIAMKKSLIIFDRNLQTAGLTPGNEYEYVANVHDEVQAEVLPDWVEVYSDTALKSVPEAGEQLGLNVPLAATVLVGDSWAETH